MMTWNTYLFPILLLDVLFCRLLLVHCKPVNNGCSSSVCFFSDVVCCWICVLFDYLPCADLSTLYLHYLGCLAFWKHSPTWALIAQLARGTGVGQDQFWNAGSPRSLSAFCVVQELSGGLCLVNSRSLHPVGQPALLHRSKKCLMTSLNSIRL